MHKSATKCNETSGKWCKNKHGASKIIDTLETYQWRQGTETLTTGGASGLTAEEAPSKSPRRAVKISKVRSVGDQRRWRAPPEPGRGGGQQRGRRRGRVEGLEGVRG
jgi:hypothetical protein